MKTTTTNKNAVMNQSGKKFNMLLSMALVMALGTTTASMAQRNSTYTSGSEDQVTEISFKNPGTGLTPVKSVTPAPILFCPALTGINMLDKSYGHIIMGWDDRVNFDSIMVKVTETGTSNDRIVSIPGNPNPGRIIINGLTGLTTYDVSIRTKCQTGVLSNWSTPETITTFAEPAPRVNNNNRSTTRLYVNPNPANGHTTVSFQAPAHVTHQVSIVNSFGTLVFKTNVSSGDGKIQLPLDLTGFTPGLYFVQVQGGATIFSKQLIVL
jgi:hypothetical protein